MKWKRVSVTSGVERLDEILGGLFIGDNVVWYDDAGSLAVMFYLNFIKDLRAKRGLSQTELAKQVGVTPSTISQVENNLIYPSLPALFKMAEVLCVEVRSLFQESAKTKNRVVFTASEALDVKLPHLPKEIVHAKRFTPVDLESKAEPYLIEIPPGKSLPTHFFDHKGEEIGYLASGRIELKSDEGVCTAAAGDLIYLVSEIPSQWKNPGPEMARLFWLKIK